jgi:anti-sigma regulatory factor (Ser/Thr protein kinase)
VPPPEIRLELINRLESLAAVAAAVDGVVACLGLDALDADRIQTAVAEACKNVVLHAYEGTEGPMAVGLRAAPDVVEATVADEGIGIRPHPGERRYPHNGLGLPIIHQHAWRVTYTNVPGGGTQVRMEFPVEALASPDGGELAGTVLGRLAGIADARAEVLIALGDGTDPEQLLDLARANLGPERDRLAAKHRAARDGGFEILVLSLLPSG